MQARVQNEPLPLAYGLMAPEIPQNVKEAAYKGMVRPILEYGSSVWDPHTDKLQEELEKVQNRAARSVTRNICI